jgi:general secretion pathway protein I
MMRALRTRHAAFTLLEVMVAVVILAVGLSSLFTSEIGAIRIAQRARTTTVATLLARCKMGEIEEKIAKEGWPATDTDDRDECCEGAEHKGFRCEWSVKRIVLPDLPEDALNGQDAMEQLKAGGGQSGTPGSTPAGPSVTPGANASDPLSSVGVPLGGITSMLSGGGTGGTGGADPIAALVMSYAFPIMKPVIEEQVRRATVTVHWDEGTSQQSFDVVQYLVNELPMLPPEEDQETDTGTGTTGTTGTTGAGTPSTSTSGTGTGR